MRAAEELARERGLTVVGIGIGIGIGVGKDNLRAAALYERLGYQPLIEYLDRYSYEDHDGTVREWVDPCAFLVRSLL